MEDRPVHAVVGDVELRGLPAGVLDRLIARGLRGHHEGRSAADRAADREGEELLLHARVRLRVREEGRVVQRDDDGNARELRAGVVGGVEHVGADLADERGQPRLLPRETHRTRLEARGNRDNASGWQARGKVLCVTLLYRHREFNALGLQFGRQIIHVAAHSAEIRGDRGGVHEDVDGFRRQGGRHHDLRSLRGVFSLYATTWPGRL